MKTHTAGQVTQHAVPDWVNDLESFRRWSDHDDFPETGQFAYLAGEVWLDMSKEQLFSHNAVKTELTRAIATLVKTHRMGRYLTDGAFLSNVEADISNQPDGMFVTTATIQENRVRIIEGRSEGYVELEGRPDMVLEIVSPSSVNKDTKILREAYAKAGIGEYWLIDARSSPLRFDILRLNRGGYSNPRKRAGWARSQVFDRWFRLVEATSEDGFSEFTLEMRDDKP